MTAISVKNLGVILNGHRILDGISFNIEEGEIVAVVGPNGSGKTTLLKAILGLVPYEGNVLIFEKPFVSNAARRIGYVPQRLEFDRTMPVTVEELLSAYLADGDKNKIREVLVSVDADKLLGRMLGVLSGGEFQRVLLALAMLNQPDILFLDEPVASVDIEGAGELYVLMQRLQKEKKITMVLVSHDLDVVYRYATEVLCINHQIVCKGTPQAALTPETMEKLYGGQQSLYIHKGHL